MNTFQEKMHKAKQGKCWQSCLDPVVCERAKNTIFFIADKLGQTSTIFNILENSSKETEDFHWAPSSFFCGYTGLILPFYYLDLAFPNHTSWLDSAHAYAQAAAEGTLWQPLDHPEISSGSSGFAFALLHLSQEDQRYTENYNELNMSIATQVLEIEWHRENSFGVAMEDYDLISGASGVLTYLITINNPDAQIIAAIHKLLAYLIWLTSLNTFRNIPNWYIPAHFLPLETYKDTFPEGYFNCSLSHGIAGPLATLSLAYTSGYHLPGQIEAIRNAANWLIAHSIEDAYGINWANGIPYSLTDKSFAEYNLPPAKASWCYGAPGIARALWLAGVAIKEPSFCQTAMKAIHSVFNRPYVVRDLDSPILCHGTAGLLAICLRFFQETKEPFFQEQIATLVNDLLDAFNPKFALGFANNDSKINDPGLLNGVSGILLALLAATTEIEPTWDRALLLA